MYTVLLMFLPALPGLALAACAGRFLVAREAPGIGSRLACGMGWVALCVLPVSAVQVIRLTMEAGPYEHFIVGTAGVALIAWWVLAGGATCIALFEETAKTVSGHRQTTMLDNWPWLLVLLSFEILVLSAILLPAMGPAFSWRRKRLWAVAAFVIADALLAVRWRWWGS